MTEFSSIVEMLNLRYRQIRSASRGAQISILLDGLGACLYLHCATKAEKVLCKTKLLHHITEFENPNDEFAPALQILNIPCTALVAAIDLLAQSHSIALLVNGDSTAPFCLVQYLPLRAAKDDLGFD